MRYKCLLYDINKTCNTQKMYIYFIFVKNCFMKQTLKYILQYVIENLKIAETKHSIIIALNGAVIALSLGFKSVGSNIVRYLNYAVLFFAGLSIIISFFALHSRNVNVKLKPKKYSDTNLLYFQNLATMTSGELLQNIIKYYNYPKNYEIDNFEVDLASTIIANSKVVKLKFKLFNDSTLFCVLSIISCLALFLLGGNV